MDKTILNPINESQPRSQMEELIHGSQNIISNKTADELITLTDNTIFFNAVVRYAIVSDLEHSGLFSPDLSDTIQSNRLPSVTENLLDEKANLPNTILIKIVKSTPTLFISIMTVI